MYVHLRTLSNIIINEYFKEMICVMVVSDQDALAFHNLPTVYYNSTEWGLSTLDLINPFMDLGFGCNGFIIDSVNSNTFFDYIEHLIRYNKLKTYRRRYLILPNGDDAYMRLVFKIQSMQDVSDILLIMPPETVQNTNVSFSMISPVGFDDVYTLLTNKFGDQKDQLVQDVWFSNNQSFLFNKNLYPDKLSNMQGHPVLVSGYPHAPYSVIGETFEESHGIDFQILAEYFKKINATPILLPHENQKDATENTRLQVSQISIGGYVLDLATYYDYYLTTPTYQLGITCIVPRSKSWAAWLFPMEQFSWEVWLCSLLILIAATVGFILTNIFKKIQGQKDDQICRISLLQDLRRAEMSFGKVVIGVFGLFVGQSIKEFLAEGRRFFIFCALFYLNVTILYNCHIYSELITPRHPDTIDTVEDLVKSDLKWTDIIADPWVLPIKRDKRPLYKKLIAKFQENSEENLIKYSLGNRYAFPVERLHSGFIGKPDYMDDSAFRKLHPMGKDLYWTYNALLLKKGNSLMPSLNRIISMLTQAGLLSYWESQTIWLNSTWRKKNNLSSPKEKFSADDVKLKWFHIQGTFVLWGIGMAVSTLVFAMELLNKVDFEVY